MCFALPHYKHAVEHFNSICVNRDHNIVTMDFMFPSRRERRIATQLAVSLLTAALALKARVLPGQTSAWNDDGRSSFTTSIRIIAIAITGSGSFKPCRSNCPWQPGKIWKRVLLFTSSCWCMPCKCCACLSETNQE